MKQHKDVPEKIVFQGTADQLEQAGDYLILLSYVRSVRRGGLWDPLSPFSWPWR